MWHEMATTNDEALMPGFSKPTPHWPSQKKESAPPRPRSCPLLRREQPDKHRGVVASISTLADEISPPPQHFSLWPEMATNNHLHSPQHRCYVSYHVEAVLAFLVFTVWVGLPGYHASRGVVCIHYLPRLADAAGADHDRLGAACGHQRAVA